MKKALFLILYIIFIFSFINAQNKESKISKGKIMKTIHWLHHSSFRLEEHGLVIYIDPFKIKEDKPADFIFITHNHYDHMSVEDIKKIATKDTLIICPKECDKDLKKFNLRVVLPGDRFEIGKMKVEVVPAYNIHKPFHPKKDMKVGYVIEVEKVRIYHAGDTDFISEMKNLKDITVAMVPIGGTFTMDPKEAAEAINAIKPEMAVPMHYGYKVGKKEDAIEFKKHVMKSIKVYIMDQEE